MKRIMPIRAYFLTLVIAFLTMGAVASGCSTPSLDTPNKRVYATSLGVNEVLQQVSQYRDEDLQLKRETGDSTAYYWFSPEQWTQVQQALRRLREAESAMYVATEPGPAIAKVNRLLTEVRALLPDPEAKRGGE